MPIPVGSFESRAVGLLSNTGHTCSAAFVSQRLAITSRHCFFHKSEPASESRILEALQPIPGENHGLIAKQATLGPLVASGVVNFQPEHLFEIREVWWGPSEAVRDDWAVLLLDADTAQLQQVSAGNLDPSEAAYPGQLFETFELANESWSVLAKALHFAGFAEDFFLQGRGRGTGHLQPDCEITQVSNAVIVNDCYNSIGASGGPLWIPGSHQLIGAQSFLNCSAMYVGRPDECTKHPIEAGGPTVSQFRGIAKFLIDNGN